MVGRWGDRFGLDCIHRGGLDAPLLERGFRPGSEPSETNGAGPPAHTVAASDSVLALDVNVAEDELTVRVLDGGLVTVARPGGGKLGLGPVRRGTRLTVLLFALNRAAGDAAESGRQLDRLKLVGGVPMPLRVSGTPVAVTWRSPEHVEISTARPANPCCVACAEATVCGLSVGDHVESAEPVSALINLTRCRESARARRSHRAQRCQSIRSGRHNLRRR